MKQVEINDTLYGPEEILDHREAIIQLRNEALKNNNFDWALVLSITVALLAALAEEFDK